MTKNQFHINKNEPKKGHLRKIYLFTNATDIFLKIKIKMFHCGFYSLYVCLRMCDHDKKVSILLASA